MTSHPHRGLVTCLLVVLRARVKGTREVKGFPALSGIMPLLPITQFYGFFFVVSWKDSNFQIKISYDYLIVCPLDGSTNLLQPLPLPALDLHGEDSCVA